MRFSIITSTKNIAQYLPSNIDSVKAQDFLDFEHVFIDAYSNDGTVDIIKKYQAQFPGRVKLFQSQAKGISSAMNKGIAEAQGEFVMILQGDDSLYDNKVLFDSDAFLKKNPELDWVYGLANVVREDGSKIMIYPNKPLLHYHNSQSSVGRYLMKILRFVPHQAVFMKKSLFEKFGGFDESISTEMDPDMWLRLRKKTKWSFFNRIICNYCMREGAQSSNPQKAKENRQNIRKVQKRHLNKIEYALLGLLNVIREKRAKK